MHPYIPEYQLFSHFWPIQMWEWCFSWGINFVQNHRKFYLKPNVNIIQSNDSICMVHLGDVAMIYLHNTLKCYLNKCTVTRLPSQVNASALQCAKPECKSASSLFFALLTNLTFTWDFTVTNSVQVMQQDCRPQCLFSCYCGREKDQQEY